MSSVKPCNKVLFYYTGDTLGDLIITTGAIALYKRKFPDAHITMMLRSSFGPILYNHPMVDDVLELDYERLKTSWLYYLKIVRKIKSEKFDISIALDQKAKAAMITYLARIPKRIGYEEVVAVANRMVKYLYTNIVNIGNAQNVTMSEFFLTIVRKYIGLHITETARPFIGRGSAKSVQEAERIVAGMKPGKLRIGLCLTGRNKLKSWPNSSTAELVDRINQRYSVNFYIVGAKEDAQFADELASLTQVPLANFCGKTNLQELAAIIGKTDLFITVDTASMHIAAALDIPMVALFGPFSPERWKPASNNAVILWNKTDCSPCNCMVEGSCPNHSCMRGLSVDTVYQAVSSQLDKLT
jgi:lipopolysaccharide heptosyltransferase II